MGLALTVQALVVKPYAIPSASMQPTLAIGQRVLVNRLSFRLGGDPDVGDIVVFHPPQGAEGGGRQCGATDGEREEGQVCPVPTDEMADTNFIKRVVAGPGDTIKVKNGIPIVNGEAPPKEDYIRPCDGLGGCNFPKEITVPEDHYFMMGDNRGGSEDSRFWGPVPRDWLIGKAFFTYWPLDRIGLL